MGENEHSKAVSRTAGAGREIQREADAKTRQGSGHNGGSEKKPVQSGPRDFCALIGGQPYRAGNSRHVIAPGPVWTPLNPADRQGEDVAKFGGSTPMKWPAQPEEIAPAYVFLAAPCCSSYITGEILPIIGGYG